MRINELCYVMMNE